MHAPTDNATPPRSALMRLLLRSWDYRLPRVFAGVRFAAGTWLVVKVDIADAPLAILVPPGSIA